MINFAFEHFCHLMNCILILISFEIVKNDQIEARADPELTKCRGQKKYFLLLNEY